ncbi:MAG: TRAP transporter substrate-binding protein DctP [Deltaproteobacteria bacterium]|nr:TRAP transporter substrate-binding protein DctP [Deltaproteobacteria bacterium]
MSKLTKILALLLVMFTATAMSFSASAAETKKTLRFTIGSGHTARSLEYLIVAEDFFMPEIQKRVAEKTNYVVEWVPTFGTVAGLSDILKATQEGLVEFSFLMTGALAGQLPYHNFSTILPFTTNDPLVAMKAAYRLYDEFPVLKTTFTDKFNQRLLAIHGLSDYGLYSSYPIKGVGDLANKKIGGSGRNLLWLQNTGAIPITSNLSDGYTSLQTKLIDAQFCAASWGVNYKFPEVAKYYTDAGLGCSPIILLTVNSDTWQSIPEEVRQIIQEVADEYALKSTEMSRDTLKSSMEAIVKQGGTIVTLTDELKREWCDKLPNLPDIAEKELGQEGLKILKGYTEILEEMGQPVARRWSFPIK